MVRIGDGEAADLAPGEEGGERFEAWVCGERALGPGDEGEAAAGVELALALGQAFARQGQRIAFIGGEEEIEGGGLADLGGELAGRAVDEAELLAGFGFEAGGDFWEREAEIGGGGDARGAGCRGAAGGERAEAGEERAAMHGAKQLTRSGAMASRRASGRCAERRGLESGRRLAHFGGRYGRVAMSEVASLKAELRAAIGDARDDGTYDEAVTERIHALIGQLTPLTPTPSPYANQDFVAGPWRSEFAQFGPKHTAGKPIQHVSSLKLQSFSKFPDVPVKILEIEQEIRVDGAHYNNVSGMTTPDGAHAGRILVWGRYTLDEAMPQRYDVSFYAIELVPPPGVSEDDFRAQFGLAADQPLRIEMKPPRLHSDVVYCDEDMRINFGAMGGVYVLKRLAGPGKSVSFD